jgi:hypothetical protein
MSEYTVKADAAHHTCWDSPQWDGTMDADCEGCDEAENHKCNFCGYGHVFTTHSDVAHIEAGDTQVPLDPTNEWHDHPHIYA